MYMFIIDFIFQTCLISQPPGWLADGRHKCHTKRGLEFKKNL